MLKLNSIDKMLFDSSATADVTIEAQDGTKVSRRDLVATGRLLTCEYAGNQISKRADVKGEFVSRLNGNKTYADLSRRCSDKTLLFCASIANKAEGREAPKSIEEVKKDRTYAKNAIFLRTLAAIASDVIQPVLFTIMDDVAMGGLMQWESVPFGGVKEIDIYSNDIFVFEDSSAGSARSASFNTLYDKTITLNPKFYTSQAKIKWYQHIVNGDIGRFYNAIIGGMWNKIYAMFIEKLVGTIGSTAYIPSGLTASTYSTTNWNAITTLVASANGIKRDNLLAFGGINALSKVLPTDGTGSAIVGLQYGLGDEWFRSGFLPNASGVQLLEVMPAIVPNTQNSTLATIGLGNNIFIAGKAGYGYAPIYGAYAEGSPLTIEMTPDATGDLTIDITVTAVADVKAVFGSKVGVITNVA